MVSVCTDSWGAQVTVARAFGKWCGVGLALLVLVPVAVAPAYAENLPDLSPKSYPAAKVYRGKVKLPDFNGRDKDFRLFRTTITKEMLEGVNFAGEYRVNQVGCGAQCTFVFVSSNRTGEVFDFPLGGDDNLLMKLEFGLDSRLMTAQWASYEPDRCVLEYLVFDAGRWKELYSRQVGTFEACHDPIDENAAQSDPERRAP